MGDVQLSRDLCDFIEKCPTAFHTVEQIALLLEKAGFARVREGQAWSVAPGACQYVVRNGSSIIAFKVGSALNPDGYRFQMTGSHTDSPTFKVKHVAELEGPGNMLRLNVEGYGGMIDASWLDRPLGIAGRVLVRTEAGRIESRLVSSEQDVALIPNVAIHQRRDVNKGVAFNHQVDLCPLFSAGALKAGAFDAMVAQLAECAPQDLLGKDLYLVNRTKPRIWGWRDEFVSASRLDDLQCAFAALKAFMEARNEQCITVFACFDNEEVGSGTGQGALSTFLRDTLVRINASLGFCEEDYLRALARSFLVSLDNGHATHPNHPELYDAQNCGKLNGGVLIKEAASQKYTTDALGRALITSLCEKAGVPIQYFANRSDSTGGSTLGNLSIRQVSVRTVDVSLAQLAMHSSYETAGAYDTEYLKRALQAFYDANLRIDEADAISF